MRTALLIFAILALSPLSAMAEEAVRIIEPWARASVLSSHPVAVYLTIESVHNDRLISVESPIADRVTIHATQSNDGVSRMMHLSALDLPMLTDTCIWSDAGHDGMTRDMAGWAIGRGFQTAGRKIGGFLLFPESSHIGGALPIETGVCPWVLIPF